MYETIYMMKTSNSQHLLEDTNSILSNIKVRTYSWSGTHHPVHETQSRSILTLKDRLNKTCVEIDDVTNNDGIVTLEVSGMIVAGCILKRGTLDNSGERYYHVSTMCSIGSSLTLQAYILREAERFALKRDVFHMRLKNMFRTDPHVDFRNMVKFFGDMGYNVTPIHSVCTRDYYHASQVGNTALVGLVNELYMSYPRGHPVDTPMVREEDHVQAMDLVRGLLGEEVLSQLSRKEEMFRKWTRDIREAGMEESIEYDHVIMWKCLLHNPEIILPTYMGRGNHHSSSVISTLALEMDRFLDVVRINTYDLKDFEVKTDQLYSACRGTMDKDYIKSVFYDVHSERYVTTVEVSGVIIAFSILSILNSGSGEANQFNHQSNKRMRTEVGRRRDMEIELLCASDYSGLGSHVMRFAEAFASRNGVNHITLTAVPNKVGWYLFQGFTPGSVVDIIGMEGRRDRGEDLREMFSELTTLSKTSVNEDNTLVSNTGFKDENISTIVVSIIGQRGYDHVRRNHPDKISEWEQRLDTGLSMDLIDQGLLVMSKDISV